MKNRDVILCTQSADNSISFWLLSGADKHYLFSQHYSKSVYRFFSNGISLDSSMDKSLANRNVPILNVMEKLPKYLRYIEQTEGICILTSTHKAKTARKGVKASSVNTLPYDFSEYEEMLSA